MPVTINGTTGISGVDGSASTPAVQGTDTNTGIAFPAADTVTVATGGSERMRIDSSGNVGIGTSTPGNKLVISEPTSTSYQLNLNNSGGYSNGNYSGILFQQGASTETGWIRLNHQDNGDTSLSFGTRLTTVGERMRITSGGYFKASNTGSYPDGSTVANHYFNSSSTSESCVFIRSDSTSISAMSVLFIRGNRNTTDNTYRLIAANNGNDTGVFNVRDSGNCVNTNNSYGSTSDVKLKQDIVDASSQWDDIKNIRIRKYRFKNNPTAPLSIGVIAQELETVSPGLVESEDDYEEVKVPAVDKEGNPILNEDGTPAFETQRNPLGTSTKSVKYSVLYMKAVKALQEAQLRIETLEAQNAAFEARLAALEAK